jgi:hypothetical protein
MSYFNHGRKNAAVRSEMTLIWISAECRTFPGTSARQLRLSMKVSFTNISGGRMKWKLLERIMVQFFSQAFLFLYESFLEVWTGKAYVYTYFTDKSIYVNIYPAFLCMKEFFAENCK